MDDFAKEVITKMETYEKKEKRQFNKYDSNMKSNKYLTIGLLTGFIVGGCIGVLAWAFLQNLFAISICAGIGMLIGIVIGTLIDYEKNNHQEK